MAAVNTYPSLEFYYSQIATSHTHTHTHTTRTHTHTHNFKQIFLRKGRTCSAFVQLCSIDASNPATTVKLYFSESIIGHLRSKSGYFYLVCRIGAKQLCNRM